MGFFDDDTDDEPGSETVTGGFDASEEITPHPPGEYKRVVDEEAGVVIYAANAANGYGIAAVPLKDTRLEQE